MDISHKHSVPKNSLEGIHRCLRDVERLGNNLIIRHRMRGVFRISCNKSLQSTDEINGKMLDQD